MLRLRLHSWMGRLYGFTVSHLLAKDLRFHSFTVVCPGSTVPRFTVVCHGCTVSRLSATVLRFDGFTVVCHGCTVPRLPATVLQFHGFTMLQPSNRGTVEPWGGGKGHTTVGRFTVRFDGRRATPRILQLDQLPPGSVSQSEVMPPDLAANSGRAARSQALKAPLKPQGLRLFFF